VYFLIKFLISDCLYKEEDDKEKDDKEEDGGEEVDEGF